MCTVDQDVDEKLMTERKQFKTLDRKCDKCRTILPQVVLRYKDVYCKRCFLDSTMHKFRSLVGKHKLMPHNAPIVVLHKTGHPSTTLLHFLRTALDLNTPRRLTNSPIFLCIEDNYTCSVEERYDILNRISKQVCNSNFPIYFISLLAFASNVNTVKDLLVTEANKLHLSKDDDKRMKKILGAELNVTFRLDALGVFEKRLLISVAKELNCKYIVTPEISVDVATNLLSDVALGRGSQLSLNVGLRDTRDKSVTIVRPLRLFEMKELAYYNIFNKLEPVCLNTFIVNEYSSVQNLMEKFIKELQVNYPATVSTIVRTGDKLDVTMKVDGQNNDCVLCKGPEGYVQSCLSSATSTRFSCWISKNSAENEFPEGAVDLWGFHNYCFTCDKIKDYVEINNSTC